MVNVTVPLNTTCVKINKPKRPDFHEMDFSPKFGNKFNNGDHSQT